jgi:hypothetical protein
MKSGICALAIAAAAGGCGRPHGDDDAADVDAAAADAGTVPTVDAARPTHPAAACRIPAAVGVGINPIIDDYSPASAIWTGSELRFVLHDAEAPMEFMYPIRMASFSAIGVKLGEVTIAGSAPNAVLLQAAVFDGTTVAVLWWDEETGLFVRRFTTNGLAVGDAVQLTHLSNFHVRASVTATGYAVAWAYLRPAIRLLSAAAEPIGAPVELSMFGNDTPAAIADSGAELAVLLLTSQNGPAISRLGNDGTLISPQPTLLSAADTEFSGTYPKPDLVWTGTSYVAAYLGPDRASLLLHRIAQNGVVLGEPIDVAAAPAGELGDFDLHWNGADLGIAWRQDVAGLEQVLFRRFDPQLVGHGPALQVTDIDVDLGGPLRMPQLVWTGDEYVVTFTARLDPNNNWDNLYFRSVCD